MISSMSKKRYEDNEELIKLVQICILKRLSTQEALKELNDKGRTMSEKTYQRIKKRIGQINKEKIGIIASAGRDAYVVESIEKLIKVRDDMLEEAENTKDFWKKHIAYSLVIKIQNDLAKFYDAAFDIGKLLNGK